MNLMKAADRQERIAQCQTALEAINQGVWPRNINDLFAWTPPRNQSLTVYAARMYQHEIDYLRGVNMRLSQGDPSLQGWER